MPDPKAHEEAQQNLGLLPLAHPVPDEVAVAKKKTPRDWAVSKGMLKLNRDRSVHYTTHTPWQYQCAFVVHRWPDPEIDPTFVLTEQEFELAIEAAIAGRSLKAHEEHKKLEESKLKQAVEQIDANNKALSAAVSANALPDDDSEPADHTA